MAYAIWAVALIVLIFIVGVTKSWLLGWLVYLVAGLALCAIIVTRRPARLLATERRMSARTAQIGQAVTVQVSLTWDRPIGPGWVLVEETLPPVFRALSPCGQLFIAGTESSTSFSYRVMGSQRGYFPIGPLALTTGDLFGLAQKKTESGACGFLTVYPKVYPVPPIRIPSNRPIGDARSTKRIFEDTTRIVGIRDYAPGDPMARIHWKTTARLGTLATKMCEASTSIEVNIVLNLHHGDYPQREYEIELACTTAASVASSLLLDKQIVGLQSNGYDVSWQYQGARQAGPLQIKSDRGVQQLTDVLGALGRLQPSASPTLAEYLTQMHSSLPWTATTLVITHYLSEESVLALESLKRSGFELAVIIAGFGEYAEASQARVAALGIPVTMIAMEKHLANLEFWQPGRR